MQEFTPNLDSSSLSLFIKSNVQTLSFVSGIGAFLAYRFILLPLFLQPLGYALAGKTRKEISKSKRLLQLFDDKFPLGLFKVFGSALEMFMWLRLFIFNYPGWEDWQNWPAYCAWQPYEDPERDVVHLPYFTYLIFCWFIFWNDCLKHGRKANVMQFMFDCHHLIAIFLTTMSLEYGWWRCGFLTRMCHCNSDLFVYIMKSFEFIYKQKTGRKNDRLLKVLMVILFISWMVLKVTIYGWLMMSIFLYSAQETREIESYVVMWALTFGSLLMWILQAVWAVGIGKITYQYVMTKGEVEDYIHGEEETETKKDK